MAKFTVLVKEVHNSFVEIEAASPMEALEAVGKGRGNEVSRELDSVLDDDLWQVTDENGATYQRDPDSDEMVKI